MAEPIRELARVAAHQLPELYTLAKGGDDNELLSRLQELGVTKLGQRLRYKEALAAAGMEDILAEQMHAGEEAPRAAAAPAPALTPSSTPVPAAAPAAVKSKTVVDYSKWNDLEEDEDATPTRAPAPAPAPASAAKPKGGVDNFMEAMSKMPGATLLKPGEFRKGTAVTITGLEKKPELNGQAAEVLGGTEDGRYPVKLKRSGKSIRIKPENLKAADGGSPRDVSSGGLDADQQLKEFVNPYDFKGAVATVGDASKGVAAKLNAIKNLVGHAESQLPEHHKKLRDCGLPGALLQQVRSPSGVFSADPFEKHQEATALRGCACSCLGTFCMREVEDNVDALVAANAIGILTPLVSREEDEVEVRQAALDLLGAISNAPSGKLAIAEADSCLGTLVAICRDKEERLEMSSTAMSILGLLLHHAKCWQRVVDAGGVGAATAMLRRGTFTEEGAGKAVGLLYILSLVGFVKTIKEEEGCLDVLDTAAKGRFGTAVADSAKKAMESIVSKMQKAAVDVQ